MGKNKGGAQNNNNTGGQGGGNHGGLSSADIARVKAMTAKEDREAKAKADSKLKCDLERKLAKKYGLKKAKGRSSTDSSDSDSDDDSSDDSDSRRKKKKARKKKQSKREKDAKSEQKRMADEMTKIKDELESAKSFKEEIRAYFKKEQPPGTPQPTMTRAQWEEFESKKRAKPPRYLFTADIEREGKSASSASVFQVCKPVRSISGVQMLPLRPTSFGKQKPLATAFVLFCPPAFALLLFCECFLCALSWFSCV